jgi:hypothetical protein
MKPDEPFLFEPPERRVDRANRHGATRFGFEMLPNPNPVRLFAQPSDGQEDAELKFAEPVTFGHNPLQVDSLV